MSLRELASRLGQHDHTVRIKYERGQTSPTVARLISIVGVLKCSPSALLARDDQARALIATVDCADGRSWRNLPLSWRH